jgi:hypothetical protein
MHLACHYQVERHSPELTDYANIQQRLKIQQSKRIVCSSTLGEPSTIGLVSVGSFGKPRRGMSLKMNEPGLHRAIDLID